MKCFSQYCTVCKQQHRGIMGAPSFSGRGGGGGGGGGQDRARGAPFGSREDSTSGGGGGCCPLSADSTINCIILSMIQRAPPSRPIQSFNQWAEGAEPLLQWGGGGGEGRHSVPKGGPCPPCPPPPPPGDALGYTTKCTNSSKWGRPLLYHLLIYPLICYQVMYTNTFENSVSDLYSIDLLHSCHAPIAMQWGVPVY